LSEIPGVSQVESWGSADAAFVYADGTTSNAFALVAPPAATRLMTALPVLSGRWLEAADRNALVINQTLLARDPSLKVGDRVTLRIAGEDSQWELVGLVQEIMSPAYAYANNEALAALSGQPDAARMAVLQTAGRSAPAVASAARAAEESLSSAGLNVASLYRLADVRQAIQDHLKILSTFLVMMSVLVLLVGGLGLASTMSMNILERRRELGIMRAAGASTRAVLEVVIGEAGVIGVLSWALAVLLSFPVSAWISANFGLVFFDAPLKFAVSPAGMAIWLGVAVVFAALASFYPAWTAARLPVREALAYE
jgi:putative ABC transport system permease protein